LRLRIKDWDRHFENAASRKLKRLDWVAIPTKTDGEGYTALVDHPNAAAFFGAWIAIVEAAAKQTPRGYLPGGIPQTFGGICQSLGRMSRIPASAFRDVLPKLLEIEWIEDAEKNHTLTDTLGESANVLAESANASAKSGTTLQDITGQDTTHTHTSVRAALPSLRKPNADDLNGQTSPNFEQWFAIWAAVRGNAYRPHAFQAYVSTVLLARESDAMECAQSYVAGPGSDPAHGYRPDNFLFEMARDSFNTRWPAKPAAPERRETAIESAIRKAKEAKNGH